jgi:hypothetical protein
MKVSREKDSIVWWVIGGVFFVFGLKYVVEGNNSDAIVHMALGLVIIAAGSEELRKILTELFLSIFTGFWKIIQK